jgi:hypothetical protein
MSDRKDPYKSVREFQAELEKSASSAKQIADLLKTTALPNFSFPQLDRYKLPEVKVATPLERNEYQSASALIKALADAALDWKNALPNGYVPGILAVLGSGTTIEVISLAQVSFNGIQIHGMLNGNPTIVLAHQATVQIICVAYAADDNSVRNPIGFIWPENRVEI